MNRRLSLLGLFLLLVLGAEWLREGAAVSPKAGSPPAWVIVDEALGEASDDGWPAAHAADCFGAPGGPPGLSQPAATRITRALQASCGRQLAAHVRLHRLLCMERC